MRKINENTISETLIGVCDELRSIIEDLNNYSLENLIIKAIHKIEKGENIEEGRDIVNSVADKLSSSSDSDTAERLWDAISILNQLKTTYIESSIFKKIYKYARINESKASLMMAIHNFNDLGKNIIENIDDYNKNILIKKYEVNLCYLISIIEDDVILNDETKEQWITDAILLSRKLFKSKNITGNNLLDDSLPSNFNYDYYIENYRYILDSYQAQGINPNYNDPVIKNDEWA